jgi:Flp pilus assembly protein TadD
MEPSPETGPEAVIPIRWDRWLLYLGLLALAGLSSFLAYLAWPRPEPVSAPAETPGAAVSPYRNVGTDIKYVGDDICGRCHKDHVSHYRQHPMGRSAARLAGAEPRERYDEKAGNPFEAVGIQFLIERRDGRVFHKERFRDEKGKVIAELTGEVDLVIGSGTHGRSYLVNRDGYLFQSPISWYAETGGWGLSPGYSGNLAHFSRPITAGCLFCHCNDAAPVKDTVNRYQPPLAQRLAIGCERCHGPGDLHVQSRTRGEAVGERDLTIVNPRHLEASLREAVCQQCHLMGESRIVRHGRSLFDYRPGLPLHQYVSVFVRPPELAENYKAVGHTEQMRISACFEKSKGKLGCISCHDPHTVPAPDKRVSFYRDRCLNCHKENDCHLEPAVRREKDPADSCTACHMPRRSSVNVVHLALTDHRIIRHPDRPPRPNSDLTPDAIPLLHFHGKEMGSKGADVSRDLALAMIEAAAQPGRAQISEVIGRRALPLLNAALEQEPDDVAAWEAKGYALWVHHSGQEALEALQTALARAPQREQALTEAAQLATELGREASALEYWQRLLQVNPWHADAHAQLGSLYARQRQWQKAVKEAQLALQLQPDKAAVRVVLIESLIGMGLRKESRIEFEKLMALKPPQPEALRRWFEERMR